jgi:FMN-dependent NADH-azoreductase
MPTLLRVDVSPMGDASVSRHLTDEFVADWKAANQGGAVVTRDLTTTSLAPVSAAWVGAAYTPADARSEEQKQTLALSDTLIAELMAADEWVFGVPMWNFGVPAVLKLWIDQIVRVGVTFQYGANGPEGLIAGKKVTFLIATGGDYTPGGPAAGYNFVEPYLRAVFGFLGVTDQTVITAGGTAALMNPATDRAAFLAPFDAKVDELFAKA